MCFPSLQKALDQSNMGAPFIAVCDVIKNIKARVLLPPCQALGTCVVVKECWKYVLGFSP